MNIWSVPIESWDFHDLLKIRNVYKQWAELDNVLNELQQTSSIVGLRMNLKKTKNDEQTTNRWKCVDLCHTTQAGD